MVGVIMAEALVSVAILATSTIVLSGIFNSSVSSMVMSRNYAVAQNLAIEAVEVVKNIKKTNSLMRPNDSGCWLALNPNDLLGVVMAGCSNVDTIEGEKNYIPVNANGIWKLESVTLQLDLGGTGTHINNESYRLYTDNTTNMLVQENTHGSTPTIYYRAIIFDPPDVNGKFPLSVKVQWKEGSRVRTFEAEFVIQ